MRLLHTESSVSSILTITTNADLAHQVEQLICNHQVVGSSPTIGTKFFLSECNVSQVRRPALEVGGRKFESCHSDQFFTVWRSGSAGVSKTLSRGSIPFTVAMRW